MIFFERPPVIENVRGKPAATGGISPGMAYFIFKKDDDGPTPHALVCRERDLDGPAGSRDGKG